jgi:hypothetical protein
MQLDAAELIRTRVDLYSLSELPASNGATLPSDRCEFEYMVFCTSMSVAPCSQRRERHAAPLRTILFTILPRHSATDEYKAEP